MTELLLPLAALSFPNIDPVIVQVGPLAVHWYGLGYVVGILFAWWYARKLVATERLWLPGQNRPSQIDMDDFVLWAAAGVMLGGRLGYVLFYKPLYYLQNPLEIIALWDGGMSFHGGLAGVTLAMIVFARKRALSTWTLFDVIAAGVPVGFGLVRVTNFINAELWGRVTDVSWGVVFCNERIMAQNQGACPAGLEPRHPSQLYQAFLEGPALFVVLFILTWWLLKLKRPGFIAGAMVAFYGCARIFAEFFRMPDAHLGYLAGGWLTMGMVLSVPMVLLGCWAMLRANRTVPATS